MLWIPDADERRALKNYVTYTTRHHPLGTVLCVEAETKLPWKTLDEGIETEGMVLFSAHEQGYKKARKAHIMNITAHIAMIDDRVSMWKMTSEISADAEGPVLWAMKQQATRTQNYKTHSILARWAKNKATVTRRINKRKALEKGTQHNSKGVGVILGKGP